MFQENSFFSIRPNTIVSFIKSKNFLNRLVIILAAFYLIYLLLYLVSYMFALPLKFSVRNRNFDFFLEYLLVSPSNFYEYPWTIVTHVLFQHKFLILIEQLVLLFFLGRIFLSFWNRLNFFILLVLSTVVGVVTFTISAQLFLMENYLSGIGSFVYGLMGTLLIVVPNLNVKLYLSKLKLKHIVLIILLLDLIFIGTKFPLIYAGYIGGLFSGFIFGISRKYFFDKRTKVYASTHYKNKPDEFTYKRPLTDEEYLIRKKQTEERIDEILDKISKYGYESLSKEEKEFLFKQSRR